MRYRRWGKCQEMHERYQNPDHVTIETGWGWRYNGWQSVCLFDNDAKKIIGYSISKAGIDRITRKLHLSPKFNHIGKEKIIHYLLKWSKEEWEAFHLADAMEHGTVEMNLHFYVYKDGRHNWEELHSCGDGWIPEWLEERHAAQKELAKVRVRSRIRHRGR